MHLYVWDRCFLLRAPSLVLPPLVKPYKRLSATLIVARGEPFAVSGIDLRAERHQALLFAPNVPRVALQALDADLMILDASIATPAYYQLQPALKIGGVRALTAPELTCLLPLTPRWDVPLDCAGARAVFDALVQALGQADAVMPVFDARIRQVMARVEELPLDQLVWPVLAQQVGLSESRLRALFQQHLGCAPTQYARWIKTWNAIKLWQKGKSFTEVAHAAGFYDLAHVDHALKELFGMSATAMATAKGVQYHACNEA